MENKKKVKPDLWKWIVRVSLVLVDVFIVNFSYFMAIVVRFYIAGSFRPDVNPYLPMYYRFTPWYTIASIVVFAFCRLYNGMWRYAGIRDLNRIIIANIITCVIHVAGTLLFIGRMPISYYMIGASIQFLLISAVRYSYQILKREATQISRSRSVKSANLMIIGVGQSAKLFLQQMFRDQENTVHPACMIDYKDREGGSRFNGIPVVGGLQAIPDAVKKYQIQSVVIADSFMPEDVRKEARRICSELNLGVQDFSGYAQVSSEINLNQLMRVTDGPVGIEIDGKVQKFENGEQAAMALPERYIVKEIIADGNGFRVKVRKDLLQMNNIDEAWVKNYEQVSGEEISFF
ncbi:MAG: hypothetical protein IJL43_06125 [Lachnospiraceae bacterium]|nr:hypothetical protein [Lachnospiraceae bacterium]